MATKTKIFGIIFNILSFAFFISAMIPSNWGNGDNEAGGPSAGFALWAYSVIFALVSAVLYTVGAFRSLKSGGTVLRLLFSIAILLLCIYVGATLDTVCMIVWNVAFAINLIIQIRWLRN